MRVTGLYVYPLKSARGLSLEEANLDAFGIEGDRRWCLMGGDGRVITQRDCPVLATLDVIPTNQGLALHAAGRRPLRVRRPEPGPETHTVAVWKDLTEGLAVGEEADSWLVDLLERPCRLVYMPETTHRQVSLSYGRSGDRVSFADGYPLLLGGVFVAGGALSMIYGIGTTVLGDTSRDINWYTKRTSLSAVLSATALYWLGDESNPMLQRLYGIAFPKKSMLEEYVTRMEEAKRRDHRRLGKELDLFSIQDETGPGVRRAQWPQT